MKTVLSFAFLCVLGVSSLSARTRLPDPAVAGFSYGRTDGMMYRQKAPVMPAVTDAEIRATAAEAATAVSCPVALRTRFIEGYVRGFREGCRLVESEGKL